MTFGKTKYGIGNLLNLTDAWKKDWFRGILSLNVSYPMCMCCGCLLTRACLQDKGVRCSTSWVSCDSTHEDLTHVIFYCPFATQVDEWPNYVTTFIKLFTLLLRHQKPSFITTTTHVGPLPTYDYHFLEYLEEHES